MPTIQMSDDQYEKLTVVVQSAGYEDVPAFISAMIDAPTEDPRGPLSEEELCQSVAMIERGNAEIEAGGGMDVEDMGAIQAAWKDEIARRLDEIDSGRVKTVPAPEAERMIKGDAKPAV